MTTDSIFRMTPIYTNSTQMESYVAAFQLVKHRKSLIDVTPLLMEDTMELIELMQRSGKVVFSGPHFSMMHTTFVVNVLGASSLATSRDET